MPWRLLRSAAPAGGQEGNGKRDEESSELVPARTAAEGRAEMEEAAEHDEAGRRRSEVEVAKSYAGERADSRHLELSSEGVGGEVKTKGISHRGTKARREDAWNDGVALIRVFSGGESA